MSSSTSGTIHRLWVLAHGKSVNSRFSSTPPYLSEPRPAAADRRGIGFGWLQNAWLLHARLKIHRGGLAPGLWPTQKTRFHLYKLQLHVT
jgi:hypothetical protein